MEGETLKEDWAGHTNGSLFLFPELSKFPLNMSLPVRKVEIRKEASIDFLCIDPDLEYYRRVK